MNHSGKKFHIVIMFLFSFLIMAYAANVTVPGSMPTIAAAMANVKPGDTVWVEAGIYKEHVYIPSEIVLISKGLFAATIDGSGRGTVVTAGSNSVISGFDIRNGTIGIFSTSSNVTITRCRIIYNQQTGIMCVGNLPKIEDNLIVYNRGSGIQGWDVRTTNSSVNHNTIAFNGNHGISVGGNSSIIVENNIFAFNEQYGAKTSDESVRISLINNNFFQNAKFSGILPTDNISLDPIFKDAKKLDFTLSKDSRCIGRSTDNQDLGARLAY